MTHDDDRFEAFLDREARAYHAPPAEVPRDAMWAQIAEARAARRQAPAPVVAPATPPALPLSPRRPMRAAPWIGMAATLLLGVGIGRYALRSGTDATSGLTTRVPDLATSGVPSGETAASTSTGAAIEHAQAPRGAAVRFAADGRRAPESTTGPVPAPALSGAGTLSRRGGNSGTYSVASQQHLTRAEALVAVVAAMPRDAMMDSLTARWAKDVLTNTRLLLDSPAGDDPLRRRLLEDLETVLVQLVQRSGRIDEDRDMLDRTLEKTQLLTRLRSGATGT
ncbi:MAG: hypothetical protein IPJ78_02080 [Gemmatimonadetes bacterium]|nr:hypothetical protein [Gemmatimonadota bacterium]